MYRSISAAPLPKRRVTILTSSGWETSLGIVRLPFGLDSAAIRRHNAGYMTGRQLVVEVVVYLDGRRPAASADALDLFEGKDAVRSHSLVSNAQLLLEAFVEVVGAA